MESITPFQYLVSNYNQQVKENTKSFYLTKMGILHQMCMAFEFEIKDHTIIINSEEISKSSKYLLDYASRIKLHELQFIYDRDCNKSLERTYFKVLSQDNNFVLTSNDIMNPLKLKHVVKSLYDFLIVMNTICSELTKRYDNFSVNLDNDESLKPSDFIKIEGDNNIF